jgi:hypothetical protein
MTSFTKFTMSASFPHQKKRENKHRNCPERPQRFRTIILFYPWLHQPEFRNITSPRQRKKLGTISEWLAKAREKPLRNYTCSIFKYYNWKKKKCNKIWDRTYNTTVISIVESSVQWCNLVLHFVTNIMIWTKLSEVSTWKFRDSYVSWFIIISVNCFHDAANRDPKLLHFKYHYPVFNRLHSLTQLHMKDNDTRNLTGFLFSMIIHFHHCYITISNTVKQAYKDGIAKFDMWCRTEEDQNHI